MTTRLQRLLIPLTVLPLALLPFGAFLTLVFVVLRVMDQFALPWVWVFAPVWGLMGLSMISLILGFLLSDKSSWHGRTRKPRSGQRES
ncbi:hypothetical protein [Deinococcus wulumuqiensis]|uniref:hypothetical protein n=1 Tax=Deinococcus wulumuqiensis TaxID=980427 RepID=UPI00242CAC6F|nr:hypothetical protein [Deinococcus wulumuqiensis]